MEGITSYKKLRAYKVPKTVLTTGQMAVVAKVAPRTVVEWFDNGKIEGYRIPPRPGSPGGGDRRIPLASAVRFLIAHGIPLGVLSQYHEPRVLIFGCGEHVAAGFAFTKLTVVDVDSTVVAGMMVCDVQPLAVVIGPTAGSEAAKSFARTVRKWEAHRHRFLAAILPEDMALPITEVDYLDAGFNHVTAEGDDPADVVKAVVAGADRLLNG